MEGQSGLSELSVLSWVSVVEEAGFHCIQVQKEASGNCRTSNHRLQCKSTKVMVISLAVRDSLAVATLEVLLFGRRIVWVRVGLEFGQQYIPNGWELKTFAGENFCK